MPPVPHASLALYHPEVSLTSWDWLGFYPVGEGGGGWEASSPNKSNLSVKLNLKWFYTASGITMFILCIKKLQSSLGPYPRLL